MQRCCPAAAILTTDYSAESELLKALADPHRLTIVATLGAAGGEICVCDLTDGLPVNQPAVSHHLRILRDAGLVTGERRGTWVYYRLARDAAQRVRDAIDSIFLARSTA